MKKYTSDKKLNIAMLGHKRIPSREGGVEIVVEELATRMVRDGNAVTCYNRNGHHVSGKEFDTAETDNYKGVKLVTVPTVDKKGLAAMTASVSAAIKCSFGKYDIVHFHAEGPCAMIWLPKMFGKKCIATIHGLDHQRAKWGKLAGIYIMAGEKCAVKHADHIIVLSQGVKDYFKQTYNRDTVFIPNGVNRPTVLRADMITSEYNLKKDDYILFLGRLVPEKGVAYLIDAYNKLNTTKKLVIAGGSSDTDEYTNLLKDKAKGNENIIFTGFVQGQILEELYSNAYIYCLPSDLEGMPLSLLEAMSYGNCCVTSDISECSEVVKDKAITFKKGNINDLAEKLQTLCDDSALTQSYKDSSADYICNKYNWDKITTETLNLYRN